MRIKNNSGQYWTGTCWGVKQAAEEYESVEELPQEIDDGDKLLNLELFDLFDIDDTACNPRYYNVNDDGDNAIASVEE